MWHGVDWPTGENLTRRQALKVSGVPAAIFDRCVELGIIRPLGRSQKTRKYDWSEVFALSRLWDRLERFLPLAEKKPSS